MPRLAFASSVALLALLPHAAQAKVVGIGIAKSNSHVYAWFDDGTVSSGNSADFAQYTHPAPFSLPGGRQPKDLIAVSIAKNDHVYAWYRDGMTSEGTSGNLGKHKGLTPFAPAAGKSVADIRAIGIAGSNNRIYAWYADGTVSVGTSGRLDAYHPATAVQLPAAKTMADVVEIDIAPDDRVYSWFSDGTFYIGTSGVLGKHGGPSGYRARRFLEAELKPGPHIVKPPHHPFVVVRDDEEEGPARIHALPPGALGKRAPSDDITFRELGKKSTAKVTAFAPPIGALDPMVAVSPHFMIISDSSSLLFADRNGAQLPQKPNGLVTNPSSSDLFGQFVAELDAKGAPNPLDINRNAGFARDCKSFPQTTGNGFCLNELYDTRVYFDADDGGHFFVQAHLRNPLWVDLSSEYAGKNGGSCGYFEGPEQQFQGRKCTATDTAGKMKCPLVDRNWCAMARRYDVIAVSKTEDPRDGFFLYASTINMLADFPWMAIHRNRVVLAPMKPTAQPPQWTSPEPTVVVLDKSALLHGSQQPPFFTYGPDDLSGQDAVSPVVQPGGEATTLLVSGGSRVRIFGFRDSNDSWKAPELIKAAIGVDGAPGGLGAVYRNGLLYLVGTKVVESVPNPADEDKPFERHSVHLVRIPVRLTSHDILVSSDASEGFLDYFFGRNAPDDAAQARLSYDEPAIAVNKNGDMLFGYHRVPFQKTTSQLPDARVTFWPANASAQFASQVVQPGTGDGAGHKIDYSAAVVDPDGVTFWVAEPFGVAGGYSTAIGHIVP